jgi:hypothetical protein
MIAKSLTVWQECWWETLSGYNLNIVYWVGKENPADALSSQPDKATVLESLCATTVLTVC